MRRRYLLAGQTLHEQQFYIHRASFEIEAGDLGRIVTEVHGGICELELYEDDQDDIRMFGIDPPLRLYTPPRRLRLELDALFEQMTVHRPPDQNQALPPPRPRT